MIQRIQSIFLALTATVMIGFAFVPIWEKTNDKTAEKIIFDAKSLTYYQAFVEDNSLNNLSVSESSNIYILVVAFMSATLALVSLFGYSKRVRQLKIGFLNSLLIVILISVTYYQITEANKILGHSLYGTYRIGFFLPLFALAFNLLASYYIKKDEDLVRSADRFR